MDRYQLIELLGSGAMGKVWRGTRRLSDGTDQDVAIKLVHEQWAGNQDALERFWREGRVCLDFHHSNIVDVYDLDSVNGQYCIVMELVDGVTLEQLVACQAIPHALVRCILRDALAGLQHAHSCSVLHRDLSPGNIMIDRTGTARLTDFGMARNLREPQTIGMLMGTMAYLAPEVLQLQQWSPGTDLYSLGAVFYELFTGEPPYGNNGRAAMLAEMRADEREPLPAHIPADIRAFIEAALDLAADRHAGAIAAADALAPADTRAQLAAMVASMLDGQSAESLETARTIPLHTTKRAASAAAIAGPAPSASARPHNGKRRRFFATMAAAAIIAALIIGYRIADRPRPAPARQPQKLIPAKPPGKPAPPGPSDLLIPTEPDPTPPPRHTEEPAPHRMDTPGPDRPKRLRKARPHTATRPAATPAAVRTVDRRPMP